MNGPAYYNEFDPFAAAWLRELIGGGHIAPGWVDERSILDVKAEDLEGFAQCHFFAGIGGWSLALRLAGWPDDRPVWTGSCPCQPLSSAGQRKGHADERHLWPAFYGLIAQRSPAIVFGEQVASALGREWCAGIRADMEVLGHAFGAADLCAASIGSPNIRQRLFWMAYAKDRDGWRQQHEGRTRRGRDGFTGSRESSGLADSDCGRERGRSGEEAGAPRSIESQMGPQNRQRDGLCPIGNSADGGLAVSGRSRLQNRERHSGQDGRRGFMHEDISSVRVADPDGRIASDGNLQCGRQYGQQPENGIAGGRLGNAQGVGRIEECQVTGRRDAGSGAQGREQRLRYNSVLIPCTDGKWRRVPASEEGEPESALFPLAHGVSNRVGILRGAGNAINPILASDFITAAEEAIADGF